MKITIPLGYHLELSGEISSPGSSGAVEINTVLVPDNDAVPGQVSGDAFLFTLAPTVEISPYSTGPVGTNAHKWVGNGRVYMPRLEGGQGIGKPQSLFGLMIVDPPGVDTRVEDALLEAYGLFVGTTLPNKFSGALQVGNPGTWAQAQKFGTGAGSRWNVMHWVTGKRRLLPRGEAATGDAYSSWIQTKVATAPSGHHPRIAGAYVETPEIEESNGATVSEYATLIVGDAPTDGGAGFESAKRRAMHVGKGPSEIEGTVSVGGLRIAAGNAPNCSNDASGEVGEFRWDEDYLYVKTNATTWKRAALSAW